MVENRKEPGEAGRIGVGLRDLDQIILLSAYFSP